MGLFALGPAARVLFCRLFWALCWIDTGPSSAPPDPPAQQICVG
jgi:hypothetical protein